nr:chemosensory protein [Odontothrips loti]
MATAYIGERGVRCAVSPRSHASTVAMAKLVLCLLVAATLAVFTAAVPRPDEKYTDKFDNINVEEVFSNKRLYKRYFDCIMDKPGAKCTSDAELLKKFVPDALGNGCSKCTDKQKEIAGKVLRYLLANDRESYNVLKAKFDPDGTYEKKYKDMLAAEGIEI